jgi:hypothetical protein
MFIWVKGEPIVHEFLFTEKECDISALQREYNTLSVAEKQSSHITSSNSLNTKVTSKVRERRKRGRDDGSRLEESNLDFGPKTTEREKM